MEETGYSLLEALLPDELAPHFGDQLLVAFDYEVARENPAAAFVTYGSSLLDTAARLAAGYGRFTSLYSPNPSFNQSRRFDREIAEKFEFLRCRPPQVVYQWMADHTFWCFYFHSTYCSHEKTEELLPVVVDGFTGLSAPDFDSWWSTIVPSEKPQYQFSPAQGLVLTGLYDTACREVEKQARERALVLQRQAGRLLAREITQVNSYYDLTVKEIEKKMAATDDAEKRGRLSKQMEATRADWQRREKDILDRHAVEVDLRLDHLVACHLPRLHIKLELQHKDRLLNITVLYNPLANALELPVCPVCRRPAAHFTPDRENRLVCLNHD